MKKYLVAANWKMNLNVHDASVLAHHLNKSVKSHHDVEVVLSPSFINLQPLSLQIDRRKFRLAAQNAYHQDAGAFTGEVSFTQLHGLVHYVLIGHSERRMHFNESLEMIRDKVSAAIRNDIAPILCIGETQTERRAGETKQVLHDQLTTALSNLTSDDLEKVVIAYEPVWAIGTGEPARPKDIEDAIKFIRHNIAELYGQKIAQDTRILYGASVDVEFVKGILSMRGVDGLLVGGASLHHHKFAGIVAATHAFARENHKDA